MRHLFRKCPITGTSIDETTTAPSFIVPDDKAESVLLSADEARREVQRVLDDLAREERSLEARRTAQLARYCLRELGREGV